MIRMLAARQIGQVVRDDGPGSHLGKKGTPTMGGALILIAVTAGTLLWADLDNRFVWIALSVTLAFGLIGFYDDYLKLVVRDPRGLAARWKYLWQSLAGLAAALALWQTAETPAETALYVPFFKNVVLPMGAAAFVVLAYFVIVGTQQRRQPDRRPRRARDHALRDGRGRPRGLRLRDRARRLRRPTCRSRTCRARARC